MKTLVTLVLEDCLSTPPTRYISHYLLEGRATPEGAEDLFRAAVSWFFAMAPTADLLEAWDETAGDLNWGDVSIGWAADYFEQYGITEVADGEHFEADEVVTVTLDKDEQLFPFEVKPSGERGQARGKKR